MKLSRFYKAEDWMIYEFGFGLEIGAYILIYSFYLTQKKEGAKNPSCTLTKQQFAEFLHCSPRQAIRVLHELCEDGYIKCDSEPPKKTAYTINEDMVKKLKEQYKNTVTKCHSNNSKTEKSNVTKCHNNSDKMSQYTMTKCHSNSDKMSQSPYIINNNIDNMIDKRDTNNSPQKANSEFEKILTENINAPSSVDEVKTYFKEKNYISDIQQFYNHYTRKGWTNPWKYLADEWEDRERKFAENKPAITKKSQNFGVQSADDANEKYKVVVNDFDKAFASLPPITS